jgi:hypothetical protein
MNDNYVYPGAILFALTISVSIFYKKKYTRSHDLDFALEYIEYSSDYGNNIQNFVVVVDSSHPSTYQLTHHLKGKNQKKLMNLSMRGDTSTDAVLNSIITKDEKDESASPSISDLYVYLNILEIKGTP